MKNIILLFTVLLLVPLVLSTRGIYLELLEDEVELTLSREQAKRCYVHDASLISGISKVYCEGTYLQVHLPTGKVTEIK